MAGPNITSHFEDQEEFDLNYHLNRHSGELDGTDSPLLCLSGNSLYHDVTDIKLGAEPTEHKQQYNLYPQNLTNSNYYYLKW